MKLEACLSPGADKHNIVSKDFSNSITVRSKPGRFHKGILK
ncbi:hypothetical protein NPIL_660261, partial [Nephila pilipes]